MHMVFRNLLVIFLVLLIACKKENKNYNSRFTLVNAVPDSKAFLFSFANTVVEPDLLYGMPVYEKTVPAFAAGTGGCFCPAGNSKIS